MFDWQGLWQRCALFWISLALKDILWYKEVLVLILFALMCVVYVIISF